MSKYLLDTNILLRLSNPSDLQHALATEAVATLLMQGNECYLTAQVLIEFWVVATRPTDVNGLGWSIEKTTKLIDQLLNRFPLTGETSQIFPFWLMLVSENRIKGKRTHDARIAAVMRAFDISNIVTLNPKDFSGISGIKVVHPTDVLNEALESK